MGQKEGAIGWASSTDRPELIAQIVTACHVALVNKPTPRQVSGRVDPITSVKSSDLLALPAAHWKNVKENEEFFCQIMADAQQVIAGGMFPWWYCPYPVSLGIYVGLRWHHKFDTPQSHPWSITDLNALFRAFFWRNSLSRRYDQGFLTQLGTDINHLKSILVTRSNYSSSAEWAVVASQQLSAIFEYPLPEKLELIDGLTNGNQGGALQKAYSLPMLAGVRTDLVKADMRLAYPNNEPIELHHIYPKNWCRNNRVGELSEILDLQKAGRDYVNSTANLMPLSRLSNNSWKDAVPGQFIEMKKLSFEPLEASLRPIFIDKECFAYLASGQNQIKQFWDHRAEIIADHLLNSTKISF